MSTSSGDFDPSFLPPYLRAAATGDPIAVSDGTVKQRVTLQPATPLIDWRIRQEIARTAIIDEHRSNAPENLFLANVTWSDARYRSTLKLRLFLDRVLRRQGLARVAVLQKLDPSNVTLATLEPHQQLELGDALMEAERYGIDADKWLEPLLQLAANTPEPVFGGEPSYVQQYLTTNEAPDSWARVRIDAASAHPLLGLTVDHLETFGDEERFGNMLLSAEDTHHHVRLWEASHILSTMHLMELGLEDTRPLGAREPHSWQLLTPKDTLEFDFVEDGLLPGNNLR